VRRETLVAANNYAESLNHLRHFELTKLLLRKNILVARRVLGEGNQLTLKMRWIHAQSLYYDAAATLEDLREAVTTLEDTERIARRVMGGAHPITEATGGYLQNARAALAAREA
jgi:hypothetical protein